MGDEGGYEWLHPATVMQALLEGACHNGYYFNVYTLTLCSVAPLHERHVSQALTHLFRKVPVLRLCFRQRDGMLWACYMDRQEIDFQVIEGEADQVTEDLGTYSYNVSEGPLWCARLLVNEDNIKTTRVELSTDFPHTRTLALASHHAMSDGTTNVQIVDFFLQILNDVVAGRDIDDSKQMREYTGATEIDEVLNAKDEELMRDQEHLQFLLEQHKKGYGKEPLLRLVLPPVQGVPYKTKFIQTVLDLDISKKFIETCKANGLTVNSGFVALLNLSLVEFMRENGLEQMEYPIKAIHAVNMRRYLPKGMSNILGAHTSQLVRTVATPAHWQGAFWEYAQNIHRELYNGLKNDAVTYLCLARKLFYYGDSSFREVYSGPHPSTLDYIAASMGNVDTLMPTEGDRVRVGRMVRFTTNAFDPMMLLYHSFRGRFHYLISYSSHLMSKEAAQKLADLVFRNLKSQV